MRWRMRFGGGVVLLTVLGAGVAGATDTRFVVARDYASGGGARIDASDWRSITWVWRSEADLSACVRSIFSAPDGARLSPLETPACERARLARAAHRTRVDLVPADPSCGRMATIRFTPTERGDRLHHVQGCVAPERLAPGMPGRVEEGRWIFVIDVGGLAEIDGVRLHRIGSYATWKDCEGIRVVVRDDLTAAGDAEALEGSKLAAAGVCLPEDLLE